LSMPEWVGGIGYAAAVAAARAAIAWSWRKSASSDLELADKLSGIGTREAEELACKLRERACAKVSRGIGRREVLAWAATQFPTTTVVVLFLVLVTAAAATVGNSGPDAAQVLISLAVAMLCDCLERRLGRRVALKAENHEVGGGGEDAGGERRNRVVEQKAGSERGDEEPHVGSVEDHV